MRLSDVLSKAPDTSKKQVENFLGYKDLSWGKHKNIKVGTVLRNHFCLTCREDRTFSSGETLTCIVTGNGAVSIDVPLRCPGCKNGAEAWFLIGCEDDLFSQAPEVYLERFTENWRDAANNTDLNIEHVDDLFERAQIAYDDGLGAGSMIYLRKIFEIATLQTAKSANIETVNSKKKRIPFKVLLKNVDKQCNIIPIEFSENGYLLFSELSEVIHGDSNEATALSKYVPCRQLVLGVVNNINNTEKMSRAAASLGWPENSKPVRVSVEGSVS